MKAVVYNKYGGPIKLQLTDVIKPTPKDDEVLVKIHASSISSADLRMLRANPFFVRFTGQGILRPKNKILGMDIAGIIESVGDKVTRFKPGDEVYGEVFEDGFGGYAEYKTQCKTIDNDLRLF
jgi:NADPH:quinone reductase-like Zn-dependent oxidoreductase